MQDWICDPMQPAKLPITPTRTGIFMRTFALFLGICLMGIFSSGNGNLSTLSDPTSAVVAEARVTITEQDTGVRRTVVLPSAGPLYGGGGKAGLQEHLPRQCGANGSVDGAGQLGTRNQYANRDRTGDGRIAVFRPSTASCPGSPHR